MDRSGVGRNALGLKPSITFSTGLAQHLQVLFKNKNFLPSQFSRMYILGSCLSTTTSDITPQLFSKPLYNLANYIVTGQKSESFD